VIAATIGAIALPSSRLARRPGSLSLILTRATLPRNGPRAITQLPKRPHDRRRRH
jgi:hypothetical protein